jgi:IS5 family transposase
LIWADPLSTHRALIAAFLRHALHLTTTRYRGSVESIAAKVKKNHEVQRLYGRI